MFLLSDWHYFRFHLGRVKRIWYLSPMRAAKVQASLRICAVSPEPPLLAHTNSESRGTFRQKASSLAPPNGWACAVKICHDWLLEDTNLLDAPHIKMFEIRPQMKWCIKWSQEGMSNRILKGHLTACNIFKQGPSLSYNSYFIMPPALKKLATLFSCKLKLLNHIS